MMETILTLGYVLGVLLTIWPLYRTILGDVPEGVDDAVDHAVVGMLAFVFAWLWPVVLVGWWSWRLSRWAWQRLLGTDDRTKVQQ